MACWSNYKDYECGRNRPLGMAIDASSRIGGASTKMAISSEHEELVCGGSACREYGDFRQALQLGDAGYVVKYPHLWQKQFVEWLEWSGFEETMCCQPLTAAQAQAIHGGAALGLAFARSGNPVIGHLTPRMNWRITCVGNFGSEVCVRKVFVGLTMHDKRLQLNRQSLHP